MTSRSDRPLSATLSQKTFVVLPVDNDVLCCVVHIQTDTDVLVNSIFYPLYSVNTVIPAMNYGRTFCCFLSHKRT